jgi:hypothetical protein
MEVLASAASSAAASVADLEAAEAALWAALPPGCRGAWEAARHATASQVQSSTWLVADCLQQTRFLAELAAGSTSYQLELPCVTTAPCS